MLIHIFSKNVFKIAFSNLLYTMVLLVRQSQTRISELSFRHSWVNNSYNSWRFNLHFKPQKEQLEQGRVNNKTTQNTNKSKRYVLYSLNCVYNIAYDVRSDAQ